MLTYIKFSLRERWFTLTLVTLTLLIVGVGYILSQTMTERISMEARNNLEENWRYQYDILVLPKDIENNLALEGGWVPPQSSIATYGGISLDDLELIKDIPGVKVAAPLSLIGFYEGPSIGVEASQAEAGTFYIIETEKKGNDGYTDYILDSSNYISYYYSPEMEESLVFQTYNKEKNLPEGFRVKVPPGTHLRYPNEILIVAVDPEAEEQLYSFSEAIEGGLSHLNMGIDRYSSQPSIPFIALKNQEYQVEETIKIFKINIPEDVSEEDLAKGIEPYLRNLPNEEIVNITLPTFSTEWRHKNASLFVEGKEMIENNGGIAPFSTFYKYSPLTYQIVSNEEGEIPQLIVKQVPPPTFGAFTINFPTYRTLFDQNENSHITPYVVGYYDPKQLRPLYESAWVEGNPIDIYTPHHSMVIEDGKGEEISPTSLLPLPIKSTYYPGAPDMLTTISAASIFYKSEPPISSVRVVVDGVEHRSLESQRKIEEVAKQIMNETGHHVEIMLGSGAGKVHVQLEGTQEGQVGKVEEAWQQQGISWTIEEQIESANLLLFSYILLVSLIFCYTVNTHSLLKRSKEFAMLRTLGWTRSKIGVMLSLEVMLVTLLSMILLIFLSELLQQPLRAQEYSLLGLGYFFLVGIGYFSGSRKALTVKPQEGLHGETKQSKQSRGMTIRGLGSFLIHQMLRRPMRFGLLVLMISMTTMMAILFLATQQSMSDFLFLSFLGEAIDLKLAGYQKTFLYSGGVISLLSIFFIIVLNVIERVSEFSLLRSIGWSRSKIQLFLCMEIGVVGLVGTTIGVACALLMLTSLTSVTVPGWYYIFIFLVPTIALTTFTLIVTQQYIGKRNDRNHIA